MSVTSWFDESYPPSVLNPPPPVVPATGATAGTPGSWTPAGSTPPADLAAANGLGYSGAAWAAGQYIVLGDSSEAYWDGAAFVVGRAPVLEAGGESCSSSTTRRRKARATEEVDDE